MAEGEEMSGVVLAYKRELHLTLNSQNITLKDEHNVKGTHVSLEWCDVLTAAEVTESKFIIHYIEQQKNKTLRLKHLDIACKDSRADLWILVIRKRCDLVPGRPKKLFVVINPIGGNGKGVAIYHKIVAPIFQLAGIETTVVVTAKSKHGLEIGKDTDFSSYHGIICVGGDGLYQEVIQGYFLQLQQTENIDVNNKDAQFIQPKIPFCLIPAGTSNGIVRYTNDDVRDFKTSALRVVRGKLCKLNLLTIHDAGKFLAVSAVGFGIGLMSDVMHRADELRWMKKARYPYAFATTMLKKRRKFHCHLEYLPGKDAGEKVGDNPRSVQAETDWIVHNTKGNEYVSVFLCASDVRTNGDTCIMDFFNGTGFLLVDIGSTNLEFAKFMQIFSGKAHRESFPHMKAITNVSGFHLQMSDEGEKKINNARNEELEHYAFVDGEMYRFDGRELDVRLQKSFVPMLSCLPSGLQLLNTNQE